MAAEFPEAWPEEFRGRGPGSSEGAEESFRLVPETGTGARFTRGSFQFVRYRLHPTGKRVVVKSALDEPSSGALEREYENNRLVRRTLRHDMPHQLAHVIARDARRGAPRLLLSWHGECLDGWTDPDRLHGPGLTDVVHDLFTAVDALHTCGLVHGAISPEHLWWSEGDGLQLSGLEGAVRVGAPLGPGPGPDWTPPGRRAGGRALAEYDVHAAGLVALWMLTGETAPDAGRREIRDLILSHETPVQELLLPVFPSAGPLPSAQAISTRIGPGVTLRFRRAISVRHTARLEDAAAAFTELRRRQEHFRERHARTTSRTHPATARRGDTAGGAGARGGGLWSRITAAFGTSGTATRTAPPPPAPPTAVSRSTVECPVCLNELDWDSLPRTHNNGSGSLVPLRPESVPADAEGRLRLEQHAYRTCPGNAAVQSHNLPERYPAFGTEPVRVGVVGATSTGKSHLLAAMIHQVTSDVDAMNRVGLQVQPLDLMQYSAYMSTIVHPLVQDRQQLEPTRVRADLHFAIGLVVTDVRTHRSHTVVFFDIAGERLQDTGPETDFLSGLNALLCVVDPNAVRGLAAFGRRENGQSGGEPGDAGDPAVHTVFQRLRVHKARPADPFLRLPCALVVGKSDLLRHRGFDEVEQWLSRRRDPRETGDLTRVEEESRDVYAMLAARGGEQWLTPVKECEDATLHLASATGTAALPAPDADGVLRFPPESFGQQRVLMPLLSLLAMKGVITTDAGRFGRTEEGS
ncbi:hypothetical protein [Streptomyces sp. NPDC059575]|uniref:hypothetical protein n=1 Tax=Streptomyces sp. NPDC059575 TaxID=3346872 RepID=UPI00369ACF04